VLVDGAQSIGAIPVSVEGLACDFLCFPGQKWLLGPDASGGVYVGKRWQERLAVALPSYFGHEPWRGQALDVPRAGATRFDLAPIPLPALAAFVASLDFLEEVGEARFARARELSRTFREALARRFEMATPPDQSTLLSFDPGRDSTAVQESLARQGVVVRTVPTTNWLRVSVGFWNSEEDLERLLHGLG
jgi:L-cysteine/cystine lyase